MLDEWTNVICTHRQLEEIRGVEMEDHPIVFLICGGMTKSKKGKYVAVKARK